MENKNFFENWMETQKKLMNNWATSTQKLQDAVATGKVAEKGSEIYNEWLNNQNEITKTATEDSLKNSGSLFVNPFQNNTNNTTAQQNFFGSWMDAQQNMMKQWTEINNRFMSSFTKNSAENNAADFYTNWMNQWTAPFAGMSKNINDTFAKDAYSNMISMSGNYFKMYELWAPLYQSMTSGKFTPELFNEFFSKNAESFKEVMDKSIASFSPVQVKELYEQFNAWFEVLNNYNRHVFQQIQNIAPKNESLFPFLFNGSNGDNSPFAVYQRAVNPLVRLYFPGKEAAMNEEMNSLLEIFSQYGNKLAELQKLMYNAGYKAYEKMVFDNYEQLKNGVDQNNFQQVFNDWVGKNEKAFIELFSTDEYSKLQGELLDLGLNIKDRFSKITESALEAYPVVTRSEADELYRTIHDLKKRVFMLEKQLNISSEESTEEKKESKSRKKASATA